jgi:hypothetical protein
MEPRFECIQSTDSRGGVGFCFLLLHHAKLSWVTATATDWRNLKKCDIFFPEELPQAKTDAYLLMETSTK